MRVRGSRKQTFLRNESGKNYWKGRLVLSPAPRPWSGGDLCPDPQHPAKQGARGGGGGVEMVLLTGLWPGGPGHRCALQGRALEASHGRGVSAEQECRPQRPVCQAWWLEPKGALKIIWPPAPTARKWTVGQKEVRWPQSAETQLPVDPHAVDPSSSPMGRYCPPACQTEETGVMW